MDRTFIYDKENQDSFQEYGNIFYDNETCENECIMNRVKKFTDGRIDLSFLRINFVLQFPHQFVWTDDKKYTLELFVGELGGVLGILLGVTALTFVEYIDLANSTTYVAQVEKISQFEVGGYGKYTSKCREW